MDDPIDRKVQCSTCGFLAKFDASYDGPPPYLYEMPSKDRESGETSTIHLEGRLVMHCFPRCFMDEIDIWKQVETAVSKGDHRHDAETELFHSERVCRKWHLYTPGFSPQQHLEEFRMQELELKRQQFEQQMANDQKAFMAKLDSGNKNFQLILGFVLGGIAILEIVVGVLQVIYPTGWPWLQSLFGIRP